MIVGIAGSRKRNTPQDKELLKEKILELKPELIVTGGILNDGPDKFAGEIAKEYSIELREYRPNPATGFPPPRLNRTREKELYAREMRRALVALHSDHLIFMTHPLGRHGEMITAYYWIRFHEEAEVRHNMHII